MAAGFGRAAAIGGGLALSWLLAVPAHAEPGRGAADGIRVTAFQPAPDRVQLDIWPAGDRKPVSVRARLENAETPEAAVTSYPAPDDRTAILFVVDTSDPTRRRTDVRQAARHIGAILDQAGDHYRFGLARLATMLDIVAPLAPPSDDLRKALRELQAQGATTELFRNIVAAVEVLGEAEATRKAIVVFSDGRHEDTAFSHEDVVAAARAAGIPIYGIGYSRTRDGTRWFQSLIRMSQETGGTFIAADRQLALPDDFAERLLAAFDRGGRAELDLTPLAAAGRSGLQEVEIMVALEGGAPVAVSLPVTLPALSPLARIALPANRPFLIAGGGAVVVLVLVVALVAARRRKRARLAHEAQAKAAVPYAFLEFFDDTESRHPVGDKAVRLGRSDDNDVRLNNTSVSAYHAEIQRRRDGTFIVTDLDSLNGVAINDEPVDMGRLQDGDVVDLGEVRFRFRLNPERPADDAPEADR